MAKINPCFKKIFITFNSLFAILGVVLFSLAMIGHRYTDQIPNMYGVIALYVIGSVIFIFSCLGVFAAYKESKWALIVFFVFMCITTIILLRVAVPIAISKHEIISTVKDEFQKMSLTKDMAPSFDIIQSHFQCCGLSNGYQDWNGQVPESCNCNNGDDKSAICVRTTSYQNPYLFRASENRWVWSKPCVDVIIYYVEKLLSIFLGLMFGLAALAILGGMMSFGMIIRVSALDPSPSQFSSQFPSLPLSYSPPKYSEVVNY
ncbi:tetraspanin-8-like [Silurus meridionalis]|uniref:tetraspanin-8-like n=1 Tax=Silurus meridionalis TaxID=175797 RepID=UPI001EEA9583|nr:tetraspanin-8-like [Silurus meridionalis]